MTDKAKGFPFPQFLHPDTKSFNTGPERLNGFSDGIILSIHGFNASLFRVIDGEERQAFSILFNNLSIQCSGG